jgi:hypothetical protein
MGSCYTPDEAGAVLPGSMHPGIDLSEDKSDSLAWTSLPFQASLVLAQNAVGLVVHHYDKNVAITQMGTWPGLLAARI